MLAGPLRIREDSQSDAGQKAHVSTLLVRTRRIVVAQQANPTLRIVLDVEHGPAACISARNQLPIPVP